MRLWKSEKFLDLFLEISPLLATRIVMRSHFIDHLRVVVSFRVRLCLRALVNFCALNLILVRTLLNLVRRSLILARFSCGLIHCCLIFLKAIGEAGILLCSEWENIYIASRIVCLTSACYVPYCVNCLKISLRLN